MHLLWVIFLLRVLLVELTLSVVVRLVLLIVRVTLVRRWTKYRRR